MSDEALLSTCIKDVDGPCTSEPIDPDCKLYMRVHKAFVFDGDLIPKVFRDHGVGMSTDWGKYATPEQVKQRARVPVDNGVISLGVRHVLGIEGLSVHHTPNHDVCNRAHTDIIGEKTTEVRARLYNVARWVLDLEETV